MHNAFSFNGTNITQMVYNGTIVWNQSLGPTVGWSGNSGWVFSGSWPQFSYARTAFTTSGFTYRLDQRRDYGTTVQWSASSSWGSVNSSGVFTSTGDVLVLDGTTSKFYIQGSGNSLRISGSAVSPDTISVGIWTTYSAATKSFSGGTTDTISVISWEDSIGISVRLATSGGLITVAGTYSNYYGAWISLT